MSSWEHRKLIKHRDLSQKLGFYWGDHVCDLFNSTTGCPFPWKTLTMELFERSIT